MRLLILGGTSEASALARRIAGRCDLDPVLSFAGRTRHPIAPPIPFRSGGFGGVAGLKAYLVERAIDAVVDATHPFAARMSQNAARACQALGVPVVVFSRPPWRRQPGDRWTGVSDMPAAVEALGAEPARVFLTIGGQQLGAFHSAPQHHYLVRAIEPPMGLDALPSHRLILARAPFAEEDETALMRAERIDTLVAKNSGGAAGGTKLAAARALGIAVIMVERGAASDVEALETVEAVLDWIERHRPAP